MEVATSNLPQIIVFCAQAHLYVDFYKEDQSSTIMYVRSACKHILVRIVCHTIHVDVKELTF